jgi:hypothetical protein
MASDRAKREARAIIDDIRGTHGVLTEEERDNTPRSVQEKINALRRNLSETTRAYVTPIHR